MIKPYYETELGELYHGDCLEVMMKIENNTIDLILTDPLYNINKAEWDKKVNYHQWLVTIFKNCEKIAKENSTLWFFHMIFTDLVEIHRLLENQTSYRHKQLITIDKGLGSVAGRCSFEKLRSFPRATEYLQFYTFEDRTGAEMLSEKYQQINPMAKYLQSEFDKAGVSRMEIAKLFPSKTGGLTGCVTNWLSGFNFPLKEQYEKIRGYLNYEYLKKEYEGLKKEYEDMRYTFNLQKGFTDVWNINFYKDKFVDHDTPKPLSLVGLIINTASNKMDTVFDPFLGSGTTAIACERLNRRWIGIEISKDYCDIAVDRIKKETAQFKIDFT